MRAYAAALLTLYAGCVGRSVPPATPTCSGHLRGQVDDELHDGIAVPSSAISPSLWRGEGTGYAISCTTAPVREDGGLVPPFVFDLVVPTRLGPFNGRVAALYQTSDDVTPIDLDAQEGPCSGTIGALPSGDWLEGTFECPTLQYDFAGLPPTAVTDGHFYLPLADATGS